MGPAGVQPARLERVLASLELGSVIILGTAAKSDSHCCADVPPALRLAVQDTLARQTWQ